MNFTFDPFTGDIVDPWGDSHSADNGTASVFQGKDGSTYILPYRIPGGISGMASGYNYDSVDEFLKAGVGPNYSTETVNINGEPTIVYKSQPGYTPNFKGRPLEENFFLDKLIPGAIQAVSIGGMGYGLGAGLLGSTGSTAASGAGASTAGGIGTTGSTLSASELASLGYTASDMAALGLSPAEIAASTAGAGGGAGVSGGLPDSYWGMQANAGGTTPYTMDAYSFDPFTGDTVGVGNTPLDSLYFSTDPSLAALGGTATGASGGGIGLSDLGKLLNTPGVSSLLAGGLRSLGGVLGANRQASAVGDANNTLWNMYQQNRADLTPQRMAGYGALGNLVNMITPGNKLDAMSLDPGYQFRKDEGQNALDMRLRAGGKFYSGQSLKDTANYNQNLASNEFGNMFNRNATLAGLGQAATNAGVQAGQQTAGQVANNQVDMGNARASGYAAAAGGVANALDTYSNAQQMQSLLDLLSKKTGGV